MFFSFLFTLHAVSMSTLHHNSPFSSIVNISSILLYSSWISNKLLETSFTAKQPLEFNKTTSHLVLFHVISAASCYSHLSLRSMVYSLLEETLHSYFSLIFWLSIQTMLINRGQALTYVWYNRKQSKRLTYIYTHCLRKRSVVIFTNILFAVLVMYCVEH